MYEDLGWVRGITSCENENSLSRQNVFWDKFPRFCEFWPNSRKYDYVKSFDVVD